MLETYSHLQICLDGPCWARTSIKCRHRDIRAKDKCNLVLVDHGGVDTSCTYVAFHPLLTPLVWVYLHSGRRLLYSSSQPGRRAYKTPTRARVWLLLHLAFFGLRSTIRSPHLRPRHAPETEPLIYYLTPEHLFLPIPNIPPVCEYSLGDSRYDASLGLLRFSGRHYCVGIRPLGCSRLRPLRKRSSLRSHRGRKHPRQG